MKKYILFLFFLIFPNITQAQIKNVGRAIYDLQSPKFQCSNFINSLRGIDEWHLVFLYHTFGDDTSCLKKILHNPHLKSIQMVLVNDTCSRNNRCGSYELLSGISLNEFDNLVSSENPKFKNKWESYVDQAANILYNDLQSSTECLISPDLEGGLHSTKAQQNMIEWTREKFPNCQVVWNPYVENTSTFNLGADIIEQHGPTPGSKVPCIVNNDGTDMNLPGRPSSMPSTNTISDVQTYINNYSFCKYVYLWVPEDNCFSYKEGWSDPRHRSCKPGRANLLLGNVIKKAQKSGIQIPPIWSDQENLSLQDCQKFLPAEDGSKVGFLWKGSDAHPGIVVLLPGSENSIKSLVLYSKGKKLFTLNRTGTFLEDNVKNRPLWRTPDSSRVNQNKLPVHVVLKEDGGKICRIIDNPRVRND